MAPGLVRSRAWSAMNDAAPRHSGTPTDVEDTMSAATIAVPGVSRMSRAGPDRVATSAWPTWERNDDGSFSSTIATTSAVGVHHHRPNHRRRRGHRPTDLTSEIFDHLCTQKPVRGALVIDHGVGRARTRGKRPTSRNVDDGRAHTNTADIEHEALALTDRRHSRRSVSGDKTPRLGKRRPRC